MKFRARKSLKLGTRRVHVKWNFTATSGYTGWGVKVFAWSWSSSTRKHRLNTPGLGYLEWGGRRSAPRRRPNAGGQK